MCFCRNLTNLLLEMFVVGLTGGIGSGKSTVAKMLTELGVDLIDADLVAREVVRPQMKAWKLIRHHFGNEVILQNGEIDRKKLAQIIFTDESKRKLLNSITHPEIYKTIFKKLLLYLLFFTQFVVLDLPLLFESGKMTKYLSKIIVVKCTRNQQIQRLIQRNNYSEAESISRIESQMCLEEKCRLSHFVVDNSLDLEYTRTQVEAIVKQLRSSRNHWKLRIALIFTFLCLLVLFVFLSKLLLKLFMSQF